MQKGRLLPADRPREIILKARDTTNPEYGFKSLDNLPIEYLLHNGVVCLDKPAGPTSHEVATWVRRIFDVEKVGHGGTLDPAVTGVLPLGMDNATKVMQALLPAGKEYVCAMELHEIMDNESIYQVINEFLGKIYQKPPLRSSVKRILRVREIYYNDILEIAGRMVLFQVGCQAGTYIRKLCYDIGEALGTGAHMRELRRTRVGPFLENEHLCNLYDLKDAYHFWKEDGDDSELRQYLLPLEFALSQLPSFVIRDSAVDAICHGANLAASGIIKLHSGVKSGDMIVIQTLKGEAVALATSKETSDRISKLNSGIVADVDSVLMERGRYPKMWKSHSSTKK